MTHPSFIGGAYYFIAAPVQDQPESSCDALRPNTIGQMAARPVELFCR